MKAGSRRPNNSIKKAVDLLYQTFNYKVDNNQDYYAKQKQEQESAISLMKVDSQQFLKTYHFPISQNQSTQKVDYDKSLTDSNNFSLQNMYGERYIQESEKQDSPTSLFKQTKKIQFFKPNNNNNNNFNSLQGNQTLIESKFGKTGSRFSSVCDSMNEEDSINEQKVKFAQSYKEINQSKMAREQKSSHSKSLLLKKQSLQVDAQQNKQQGIGSIKNTQLVTKSNFYETEQFNSSSSQQPSLEKMNESTKNDQISKVQEVLKNIQDEEQSNKFNKKRKNKRRLYITTNNQDDKKKTSNNKNQQNTNTNNNNNGGQSATSIKDTEEDIVNNIFGISSQRQQDGKNSTKNQHKQQELNLENFRLHRNFSEEELEKQQLQLSQEQKFQNNKLIEIDSIDVQNQRNNWILSKKASMIELFDKHNNNNFSNQYLDQYTRLGMEEWKTSKQQIGDFLWNAKINQLKANIKQKMPAYSTTLLKRWEDYELQPSNYSSKRNISHHKMYTQPHKYKHSFNFYSPSNDLANPNKAFITSQTIYNQPIKLEKPHQLEDKIKQKNASLNSLHVSLRNNQSNGVQPSTTKSDSMKQSNNYFVKSDKSAMQQKIHSTLSYNKPFHQSNSVNYQQQFQSSQNKLIQMKNHVEVIEKRIKDHLNQTKDKPIIPKQLIEMAKKQSQTSFFQLKDLGKKKKTFNFFEKTPQYSTQEDVDDLQTIKQLKQRSNTYKIFRNHVRQYLSSQKD